MKALLAEVDLTNVVVTGGRRACPARHRGHIVSERGGAYGLTVKGN